MVVGSTTKPSIATFVVVTTIATTTTIVGITYWWWYSSTKKSRNSNTKSATTTARPGDQQTTRQRRTAIFGCVCGKFQAKIDVPSQQFIDIPSFQCACNDCVNFCEKVLSLAPESTRTARCNFCSPGAHTLLLMDSEIITIRGGNDDDDVVLSSMKLSTNTPNRRIYTSCCGTPIGISVDDTTINMIYVNNISNSSTLLSNETVEAMEEGEKDNVPLTIPPATVCVHYAKARESYKLLLPASTRPVHSVFAPRLIISCLSRLLYLTMFGESRKKEVREKDSYYCLGLPKIQKEGKDVVTIGLDSIRLVGNG